MTVTEGIELAARFIEKRRDDYVQEHGSYDPSTGMTEFPGDGEEYVGELEEIIEGIRDLTAALADTGKVEPEALADFSTVRVHTGYSIANGCWFVRAYPFQSKEQAISYADSLRTSPPVEPQQADGWMPIEEMVEAAEEAVYGRHERGFIMRPLVGAIDMRAAAALRSMAKEARAHD